MKAKELKSILELILKKLPQDKEIKKALVTLATDVKFIDLPPVVVQRLTDLYALSNNGTGSYKETRQQLLDFIKSNVGFAGTFLKLNEGDFIAGVYQLTNPMPVAIVVLTASADRTIKMADMTALQSVAGSQTPYIANNTLFNIQINALDDTPIFTLLAKRAVQTLLTSNGTPAGTWDVPRPDMISLAGLYGTMDVNSPDGSIDVATDAATNSLELQISATGNSLQKSYDGGAYMKQSGTDPVVLSELVGQVGDPSSLFEIATPNKGARPYGIGTVADRDAVVNPAVGLLYFTTDIIGIHYFDGIKWQSVTSFDSFEAGDNITFDQTVPGILKINSSGVSPSGNSDYASWGFTENGISTLLPTIDTFLPIAINVATFSDLKSSGFVNEVVTISSNPTPVFRYNDEPTQFFIVNFNIFASAATPLNRVFDFQIFIQRADTSIEFTGAPGKLQLGELQTPYDVSLSTIVQLSTGDRVGVCVKNPTTTDAVLIETGNAVIFNINAALAATLQTAWANGSGIVQGDLATKPVVIKNNSSETVLQANESYVDLPKNYGNWAPVITNEAGISGGVTIATARYIRQGAGILCCLAGSFTATDSDVSFDVSQPITPNFSDNTQANLIGGSVLLNPPNVADGNPVGCISNDVDQTVTAHLNATTGSGTYSFNLTYLYEVQP